jgi:putative transcriptional regulator
MTKLGQDLIESAKEALRFAEGEEVPGVRVFDVPAPDVAAIRKRLGLPQAKFAERFDLSAATVRDREQGRRVPDRTARALLRAIDRDPEAVAKALRAA